VAGALAVFHFAVPFLLLLMRRNKRRLQVMGTIAVSVVAMRAVDLLWLVAPAHEKEMRIHWLDAGALLGIGGLFMALFSRQLRKKSLLPLGDPDFPIEGPS
jgi:peptidoglycan/LPS O-acetylase OafA/YrhL